MEFSAWRRTCTEVAVPWVKGKELRHIHSNGNSALYYIEKVHTSIQIIIIFCHTCDTEKVNNISQNIRFHVSVIDVSYEAPLWQSSFL